MSISVLFNGITYSIPETGEESWGENLTSYFTAIPQGALQKTGGSFTLTADVNFGANYGLLSKYFSTRTALPSTAGVVRLAVTDSIGWRNNANGANLLLAVNGSNQLTFNGSAIYPGGITALTGDVTATGPGSVAATVAFVGSYSAANVAAGATLANAATSANTVSAIVKRDSSGNFVAGTITASLTGTASGNTTISANQYGVVLSGSANVLSVLAPDASTAKVLVSGGASANPAWSLLTNTNLSGSAAISNANLAAMASASSSVGTVKGNISGSSAVPSDIVLTSANTVSSVVYRDSSGNFSATTITAAVTGSASGNLSYSANQYGVLLSGSANVVSVLAPDASSAKVLISGGASANPAWSLIAAANISATAAIAFTQLASLTSTNILVGSSGNVATSVAMSGDITIGNTGVTAIGSGKVTNSMLATASSAATASYVALRDANANLLANNQINGFRTQATANSTLTLVVGDAQQQTFTGTTAGQIVQLPTTSIIAGQSFQIVNLSNQSITVNSSGGNLVQTMAPSSVVTVTAVVATPTTAANWTPIYSTQAAGGGSVTSVALTVPTALFATSPVTGSPVTSSGTLAPTLATQAANSGFYGPSSGSAATPTFRAAVPADIRIAYNAQTISYTLLVTDSVVGFTTGSSSLVATLPTAASVSGSVYTINKVDSGSGKVTLATTSSQTVGGFATSVIILGTQNDSITVVSDGTNWQIIEWDIFLGARAYGSTTTIGTGLTTIVHPTIVYDPWGIYNVSTGAITIPIKGKYRISFALFGPSIAVTAGSNSTATVTIGGTQDTDLFNLVFTSNVTTRYGAQGSAVISCATGDAVLLKMLQPASGAIDVTNSYRDYFEIERIGN